MKAQGSLEFPIIFGILLIFYGLLASQSFIRTEDIFWKREQVRLKGACFELSRAVLSADLAGNGYREVIYFEEYINFSVDPSHRTLEIEKKEMCYLSTPAVEPHITFTDTITIRNVNGTVVLE